MIAGLENLTGAGSHRTRKLITGLGRDRLVAFQESALFPWLDVFGNVLFPIKASPGLDEQGPARCARYYLEVGGADRFEDANIHELSGVE